MCSTTHLQSSPVEGRPGFELLQPVVFSGLYPSDSSEYDQVAASLHKLALTDPAVFIQNESSLALGTGFRLGFLGTLHMSVFLARLNDEYNANVIMTSPSVQYLADVKVFDKSKKGTLSLS